MSMAAGPRNCIIFGAIFISVWLGIFGYHYFQYKDFVKTDVLIQPSNCSTKTEIIEHEDTKTGRYTKKKVTRKICDLKYSYTYNGQFYTFTSRSQWHSGEKTETMLVNPNHPDIAEDTSTLKTLGWIFFVFGAFLLLIGIVERNNRH